MDYMTQKPTIVISEDTKGKLDNLKLVPNETYDNIIRRIIESK